MDGTEYIVIYYEKDINAAFRVWYMQPNEWDLQSKRNRTRKAEKASDTQNCLSREKKYR